MKTATSVLFMIGAAFFALGSLPLYFDNVDGVVVALTFFVGSLIFTTAAYLAYRGEISPGSWFEWRPESIDWRAAAIQLGGTLAFNVSTFFAIAPALDATEENRLAWAPDAVGSTAFFIASALGLVSLSRADNPSTAETRSARLNMAGSIAFGLAAVGARTLSTTGDVANTRLVNTGTFIGAACFFIGAALTLPAASGGGTVAQPTS